MIVSGVGTKKKNQKMLFSISTNFCKSVKHSTGIGCSIPYYNFGVALLTYLVYHLANRYRSHLCTNFTAALATAIRVIDKQSAMQCAAANAWLRM